MDGDTLQSFHVFTDLGEFVYKMALSPDGEILAITSTKGATNLWDVREGTLLRELIEKTRVYTAFFHSMATSYSSLIIKNNSPLGGITQRQSKANHIEISDEKIIVVIISVLIGLVVAILLASFIFYPADLFNLLPNGYYKYPWWGFQRDE